MMSLYDVQIIVVIAVFNVISFVTYLNEIKSKEIFLFRSLGISNSKLAYSWAIFMLILWFVSIFCSHFFLAIFDWGLNNWSVLQLPGDVYYFSRLKLILNTTDFILQSVMTLYQKG